MLLGFITYLACAFLFFALAVYALLSHKPIGMWANVKKQPNVKDVKGYNRAASKVFFAYGFVLCACGLPMLFDANPAVILLVSVLAPFAATIAMIITAVKIEEKYKKKR